MSRKIERIREIPKFVTIDEETDIAGFPISRTHELSEARKRFVDCHVPLAIPPGTYRRTAYDRDLAILELIRFGEPWLAKTSWVTRTRNLLPRRTLYSRELPLEVPPQDLRRPCIHPNAPSYPSGVWRYMDRWKFESMLEEGGIFLARSDRVADRREGSLSLANLRQRARVYRHWQRKMTLRHGALVRELANIKRWTYISCWRVDEHENQRSWDDYVSTAEGIAIKTSYRKLLERTATIFCTGVEYIDYDGDWVIETDPLSPFSYKAKEEFEWEREFRIIIQQFPKAKISFDDALYCNCAEENPHRGIFLTVDITRLIDKIVVAPHSSNESYHAVQHLTEDFGLADRVMRSALENSWT